MKTFYIFVLGALAVAAGAFLIANSNSGPLSRAEAFDPTTWPQRKPTSALTRADEARIEDMIAKMPLEQKVGQLIIADINTMKPEDLESYPLGAILAGGNSGPYGVQYADMQSWLNFADAAWQASQNSVFDLKVPPLFGIDAVHGHNNVSSAVLFPHNIGLGAANDEDLIRRLGAATAHAVAATGHDWTFAPTVAVAHDLRWGRAYESYSSDPERVRALGKAFVDGVQTQEVGPGMILATAKHFIGDGATKRGKDQGDATITEAELESEHAPGFYGAMDADVATVMASYNSWNGLKLHGHEYLLTDILKERLAFDGLVVGDWDAHAQLKGCSAKHCPAAINAGIDMLMAPTEWKALYASLLNDVKQGVISAERLDDAVARVLNAKIRAGVLDAGIPSSRPGAGHADALSGDAMRALAREAVRSSLVLLKNDDDTLPIQRLRSIAVIGAGADNYSAQAGGWSLTWQGDNLTKAQFPVGQTLLDGLKDHAAKNDIRLVFDPAGDQDTYTDLAIVVLHEDAYAEYFGDLKTLAPPKHNKPMLAEINRLHKQGVPVVTVLLSGRPLPLGDALENSAAVIAAWLPGTEGGGVADLIFGETLNGAPLDFKGQLSFDWPASSKPSDGAVFPVGYGLHMRPALSQQRGIAQPIRVRGGDSD